MLCTTLIASQLGLPRAALATEEAVEYYRMIVPNHIRIWNKEFAPISMESTTDSWSPQYEDVRVDMPLLTEHEPYRLTFEFRYEGTESGDAVSDEYRTLSILHSKLRGWAKVKTDVQLLASDEGGRDRFRKSFLGGDFNDSFYAISILEELQKQRPDLAIETRQWLLGELIRQNGEKAVESAHDQAVEPNITMIARFFKSFDESDEIDDSFLLFEAADAPTEPMEFGQGLNLHLYIDVYHSGSPEYNAEIATETMGRRLFIEATRRREWTEAARLLLGYALRFEPKIIREIKNNRDLRFALLNEISRTNRGQLE